MADEKNLGPAREQISLFIQQQGLLEHFNLPPKLIRFLRLHQRLIWIVVSVLLALALAIAIYSSYVEHRAEKAAVALDKALVAKTDKRQQLEAVARSYSATPSSTWASIELARLDEQENKIAEAIQRYEAINQRLSAKSLLKALALNKLVALAEQQKDWDKALTHAQSLALEPGFEVEAQRIMGRLLEQQGKKQEAIERYRRYLDSTAQQPGNTPANPMRSLIQSRLNILQQ